MDSSSKRFLQYFSAPVLCAAYVLLLFWLPQLSGIVLGVIALFVLIKYEFKKNNVTLHLIDISILILLLVEFNLTIIQTQGLYSKTYLFSLICNFLAYFVLRFFLLKETQIRLFVHIIAGFVILLVLLTICSFFFFKFKIEYEGFTDLVNFKALFKPLGVLLNDWSTILLLSSFFPLLALAYSRFKSILFWIFVVGCGLLVMSLLVSFSRGIYISIIVGIFVFIASSLFFNVLHLKKLAVIVGSMVILGVIVAFPVFDGVKTTFGFSVTTSQERSTESRINFARTAFELFKKNPVTGVGVDNFSKYSNPILATKEDSYYTGKATNTYLQLLAEQGIIGFILWGLLVGILLFVTIQLIRNRSKNSIPLLISFSVIVAVLFREVTFSTFFSKSQMQLLLFVIVAWIVNHDKKYCYRFSRFKVRSICLSLIFVILAIEMILYKIAENKNDYFIAQYQEHNYSGALTSINSALKIDPKNSQLLSNMGFLFYQMQQTDSVGKKDNLMSAVTYYKKAVVYSPQDPYLHLNLANLFAILDKTDSANIHYQKACELSHNTALFYVNRGMFFDKNGKNNDAWKEYQKAIRLSPDILDSKLGTRLSPDHRAVFNQMLNEIADSLSLKIKCTHSPIIKSRLAKILSYQGDTSQATLLLEQVSAQLPNLDRVWYQLGILKLAQNDTMLFLKYLKRAMLLDSRDFIYPLALGDFYYHQNKAANAIFYYKQSLFNYANIYTFHAIIAPDWYGYKSLSIDILPVDRFGLIKLEMNTDTIMDKLIVLYKDLELFEKVNKIEECRKKQINIKAIIDNL